MVAGAGPVGLTAALCLARRGLAVTVFESHPELNSSSQASTFHPTTLELLDELGIAWPLIATGNPVQRLQYRDRKEGLIAEFDYAKIRDATRFPVRVQTDQSKLTRLILDTIRRDHPDVNVRFSSTVIAARDDGQGAEVDLRTTAGTVTHRAGFVVGADGAHSAVRHSLGIGFEGSVYGTRHLMITTSYDVLAHMPELAPVTYLFDDQEVTALLTLKDVWRIVFMIPDDEPDDVALDGANLQRRLQTFLPPETAPYPILDARVSRLHARTATRYRHGRVLLAGDAAHLNHPLGGLGLNSGLHDAYVLAMAIADIHDHVGGDELLTQYADNRRTAMVEKVIPVADGYSRDAEEKDPSQRRQRNQRLRSAAADPAQARQWLLTASMFDSAPRPRSSSVIPAAS
ncbi:MAG: NAD(P)/FAD-dependent oxidoreductase [Candidatus Dormiibacterota bacterium]